ncbi:MAG: sulfurtransferase [Elusimicrobia bacterium GWB2_63_22]|nr:MAG: sulfurtransferase [Elusimicrobia bacterium GWB2_63_22]
MTINDALRLLAGFMILLSVGLAVYVDKNFLWLTAFVGANLLQSAFTRWCPAIWAFRKLGLKES